MDDDPAKSGQAVNAADNASDETACQVSGLANKLASPEQAGPHFVNTTSNPYVMSLSFLCGLVPSHFSSGQHCTSN